MAKRIELGATYQHKLHKKLKGKATGVCTYLTGCDQVCLETIDKDGDVKAMWIDIIMVKKIKKSRLKLKGLKVDPGGPQHTPPSRY